MVAADASDTLAARKPVLPAPAWRADPSTGPEQAKHTPPWRELFDAVVVLSLPSCTDRRQHIARHLPEAGIERFEFFDATALDDPLVARAYASGSVATYPTCFRCGKLDCGDAQCNNFLIPQQVATFISYLRLWQSIAAGPARRVLVVEDDVQIHDHAGQVLSWLRGEVAAGRVPFRAGVPCLLRLGWAACAEHAATGRCFSDPAPRMSNPCHAITREFAALLLQRYAGIVHTVDVYQHQLAPRPGEAFTVFPPIASELSWSDGRFSSTIHPKPARTAYLQSTGQHAGAAHHEAVLHAHVKKKHFRPLLLVGHPRCGTGYAASLCRQLGLDVGHEKLGADGISSWMFAVDADHNPYAQDPIARTRRALAWKHLILPVRDLASAAPSVIRDSLHAPPSYAFRREHILRESGIDLDLLATPLERAVRSVTAWARIVLDQGPALWFRIEDQHHRLRDFLIDQGLVPPSVAGRELDTTSVNADKPYQGVRRPKPVVDAAAWHALPAESRAEIDWYCRTFGYASPLAGKGA